MTTEIYVALTERIIVVEAYRLDRYDNFYFLSKVSATV